MGRIYKDQDSLRIKLTTNQDITGASVTQIKYEKPDGTTGNWSATVDDATNGIIYYDLTSGDLDQAGRWGVWVYITFADGRSAPGEPIQISVYEEGQ